MLAVHTPCLGPPVPLEYHVESSPIFPTLEHMYSKDTDEVRTEYKHTLMQVDLSNRLNKSEPVCPPHSASQTMEITQYPFVSKGLLECPRLPPVITKNVPAGLYRLSTLDGFAYAMVENEDDDEEDFESECDDFYDEDEESSWQNEPESTTQLLNFASAAASDIQRYFGRNRGNEDFCDVFEDKFKTMKSGRELYYADLLTLAQFEDNSDSKLKPAPNLKTKISVLPPTPKSAEIKESSHTIYTSQGNPIPCRQPHLGRLQSHVGLGPFQELFDSVLRDSLIKDEAKSSEIISALPSTSRQLDMVECEQKMDTLWDDTATVNNMRILPHHTPSGTLDFSDLLARWTVDASTYS